MANRFLVFLFVICASSAHAEWAQVSAQSLNSVPGTSGPQSIYVSWGRDFLAFPSQKKLVGEGSPVKGGGFINWISGPITIVGGKWMFFVGGRMVGLAYSVNLFRVACVTTTCSAESVFVFPLTGGEDGWVQSGPVGLTGVSFGLVSQDRQGYPTQVWVASVDNTGAFSVKKVGMNIPRTIALTNDANTIDTRGPREIFVRGTDPIVYLTSVIGGPVLLRYALTLTGWKWVGIRAR